LRRGFVRRTKTVEEFLEKVKGHQKGEGPHKGGNDRADELAVAAKREAGALGKDDSAPLP
jgi:hypothetical protein